MLPFGKKRRQKDALDRAAVRPSFEAAGWRWEDATPPPALEIQEAALRVRPREGAIWPTGMSEVATGDAHGYPATAGRLVGYEYGTTNSGTKFGHRVETNVLWLRLPDVLPEIRFGDATLSRRDDHGVRLPPLPRPPFGPSARWSVEGFIPAFAADLLTPGFVSALETAPERTPVVIRAGHILTYGFPTHDLVAVQARAALLAALLQHVPAAAWGRADALVAGTGVSPRDAEDGPALRLDHRLIARDWKGQGLQKIDWRETPTAEYAVTLSHREAVDVWEGPSDAEPGLSIGLDVAGLPVTRARNVSGVPTVASTLARD
ncbi:hypothetical protein AB0N73_14835 [Microbacterium sp. NPDC089189]|uniref:hypothetical protein n=1 Tax=Microbacterium sp. NPDC089189 TaxID=3154972 RepID=UPI00343741BE